ncbi:transcriptional regulator, TetR family [Beutenbergia cavernae DSM 12333]|uniref:Transcriptional regulator, TetR family n=1 Tax=Beutenbergia cavernae (strain ATCC BAA-8 / DSM 12333 / CCUG 43141 / JCM 11478 / NBRC 16432 / NCIMB 13614 / HKI 0122) TaxID=471853 RepID=C5C2E3_BEUC1|nr:TetR/AcrR family transcriptional regulator [Beutenbergia cavernae]ACQ79629.1 transcriptional regulator, TetR family [Beutenbergia cavernae DSM 12333]
MPRTPVRTLGHDAIVAAAVELADAQGIDAVSMRRVAEQLGAGTMSLYRHVATKDELVAAMVERVTDAYAYPDPAGMDWRARMHAMARREWDMYVEHPWVLVVLATATPPFGPASFRAMEWALAALEPLRLAPEDAGAAIMTVTNYLQGSARVVLGRPQRDDAEELLESVDPGTLWRERLSAVELADYPRLRALISSPFLRDPAAWFENGLDVVLDGVAARARS